MNHATAGGDGLGWTTFSFLAMLTGAGCLCLGGARMRALAFPFAFLILAIPMPDGLRLGLETALQHGSAEVAAAMFQLVGTPLMRDGMVMRLPGMNIEVAPECSGIHSTLVLFITSILAGHLILRGPWRRTVLCLAVIPLALLRNGFRILVIGELCVHVGPQMIDSPIHHHGGPLFFALSLVPFFLLLYYLRKPGRPAAAAGSLPIPK
jgi:exosortase C (VPDSG-CTERM-specific)